jgi:hypothetical protein
MITRPSIFTVAQAVAMLFGGLTALAELPNIRLDRIQPLGANAGTTTEVEFVGNDMEDVNSLWISHAGITAAPVDKKDRRFNITVAADVPAGTYDLRLVGRYGVSNPRLFAVTRGLKDVDEKEPNNEPAQSQPIAINSAIAGVSDGNNDDFFRIALKAGERVVIDCQAGKLDSPMDANLAVMSLEGKQLAASSDYNGRDPLLAFSAASDGEYLIRVFDLSYRGGFPYRLLVTDKPYVTSLWPRVVQAGLAVELTARGHNLGPKASRSERNDGGLASDEFRFPFTAPAEVYSQGAYRYFDHPTDHSPLPTAATCTLTGMQVRPPIEDALNALTLVIADSPVILEAEPNDTADKAQKVSLPLAASGRFDGPRDADWYEIDVPEPGGPYAFNVYCERIKGFADPYVVIVDDKDNRVQELDDFGISTAAFTGNLRDPVGVVSLNGKRKYRVLVQDRYRRGGERYQYVLTINKARPDFYAAAIHSQNPGPGALTVWRGGAMYLDVVIHQLEGYNGPITVTAHGLPQGVTAMPTVLGNNNRGAFVLRADDQAADFTGPISLIATGQRGDQALRREVRPYTRVSTEANKSSSRPMQELMIAVRGGAPYRLEWTNDRIEMEAGAKAQLILRLTRLDAQFKGEVNIQPLNFPGQFKMANSAFKSGEVELMVPVEVQKGTPPGDYTLAVLGQGQVPFNKDAKAKERPNTLVSLPSNPFTITVKAAPK